MDSLHSLSSEYGKSFSEGQIIFKEGESGEKCFIVLSGRVELFKNLDEGKMMPLAVLGKGEIFGEMGLIDSKPRSATARAHTPVKALELNKKSFLRIVKTHPKVSFILLKSMSERLRDTGEKIKVMANHFENLVNELKETSFAMERLTLLETQTKKTIEG